MFGPVVLLYSVQQYNWSKHGMCTASLNKKAVAHSTLLRSKNVRKEGVHEPCSDQLYSVEQQLSMCTQNILNGSACLKTKVLATKCKQRIDNASPKVRLKEVQDHWNCCQPICPHREEAHQHHSQPKSQSPMRKKWPKANACKKLQMLP
jgi:hypothetical protein